MGVTEASVGEIDSINILQARLLAMRRAVDALTVTPQYALVDGTQMPRLPFPGRAIIAGDALEPAISAASILAKTVARGMRAFDAVHPGYGFAQHMGYATPEHCERLQALGPASCIDAALPRFACSSKKMRISSTDNPIYRRLKQLATSARACREARRTLIEGVHLLQAALAAKDADSHPGDPRNGAVR